MSVPFKYSIYSNHKTPKGGANSALSHFFCCYNDIVLFSYVLMVLLVLVF